MLDHNTIIITLQNLGFIMLTPQGKRRAWMFLSALVGGGTYAAVAVRLPIVLGLSTQSAEIGCQVLLGVASALVSSVTVKLGYCCYDSCKGKELDLSKEILDEIAEGDQDVGSSYNYIRSIVNVTARSARKDQATYLNALAKKFHNAKKTNDLKIMQLCRTDASEKIQDWIGSESEESYLDALHKAGYIHDVLLTALFSEEDGEENDEKKALNSSPGVEFSAVATHHQSNDAYIHFESVKVNKKR